MKITDIQGDYVKINKNSMTVKDERGKTKGVIRNISALMSCTPSRIFEISKKIKPFEDYENKVTRAGFYIVDNNIYYMHSINGIEFYKNQIARFGKPLIEEEYTRHINHEKAVDKLRESNIITVIDYKPL